ncbi:MAG: hypothetical protein AB2693_23700, partial [Candidatus Thiodiazotropha sp.]
IRAKQEAYWKRCSPKVLHMSALLWRFGGFWRSGMIAMSAIELPSSVMGVLTLFNRHINKRSTLVPFGVVFLSFSAKKREFAARKST